MANELRMAMQQTILELWKQGWAYRRIARELGVHRHTVSRLISRAEGNPKATISTAGSGAPEEAKPTISTAGKAGRQSVCEPYREKVQAKLDAGLSAVRIWQDLAAEVGYTASYESVKRYVRKLAPPAGLPFRRLECAPGEEAQVDFGQGAWVDCGEGKKRRPHVLRIVLSHSRKGYSEVVWRQTTEDFIRAIENAFWAWGGVPRILTIDNLKAAVTKADWFDPELNPKIDAFARHYGLAILPTRPYTPRHKGKVERGVAYVQDNALKGRIFPSLEAQNVHLREWEQSVADQRLHGTTRQQVKKIFLEAEKAALLPLPAERFPYYQEAQRSVHRDGHVEVAKAYYSVPPEYVRARVWVRWDPRLVRVYNVKFELVATHARCAPGKFRTNAGHIASEKIAMVEGGAERLLRRTRSIGPETAAWSEEMLKNRGIEGVRVLVGMISLAGKHPVDRLEQACCLARKSGAFHLRTVRELLARSVPQPEFEFMDQHPLIRPTSEYGELVKTAVHEGGETG